MTILLPTLGVAFAAACVWLGVRFVNRRERWAKSTLAVSGLANANRHLKSGTVPC